MQTFLSSFRLPSSFFCPFSFVASSFPSFTSILSFPFASFLHSFLSHFLPSFNPSSFHFSFPFFFSVPFWLPLSFPVFLLSICSSFPLSFSCFLFYFLHVPSLLSSSFPPFSGFFLPLYFISFLSSFLSLLPSLGRDSICDFITKHTEELHVGKCCCTHCRFIIRTRGLL